MSTEESAEWRKFIAEVTGGLFPKVASSGFGVTFIEPTEVNAMFAVQLGVLIMHDKPILALVAPGVKIPEKVARVVDEFVEMESLDDPTAQERVQAAITRMMSKVKNPDDPT